VAHPRIAGTIEVATREQAGVLAAIHRAAFPRAEAWSRDVMLLHLEMHATFGLLHPPDGMILARVAADEGEILTLAVSAARRRLGLGSALLRAAMERAAGMGAASMFLEVAVNNDAARALYAAHGFAEVGLRRNYYSDGTDALILRSTLAAGPRGS
jgi:[ribosomal protein S18]-alanine N-acetyltransferase